LIAKADASGVLVSPAFKLDTVYNLTYNPPSLPPSLSPSLPSTYRDCRALNRIQIAKADTSGVLVSPAFKLDTVWDLASFSTPKAGMDSDGSW